jgi:hypothetical protein
MGMHVVVKLDDLVRSVPHLAGLSIDKTEFGDTVVLVSRNEHQANGNLFEDTVSFSRSATRDIVEICLSVGIPFEFF